MISLAVRQGNPTSTCPNGRELSDLGITSVEVGKLPASSRLCRIGKARLDDGLGPSPMADVPEQKKYDHSRYFPALVDGLYKLVIKSL